MARLHFTLVALCLLVWAATPGAAPDGNIMTAANRAAARQPRKCNEQLNAARHSGSARAPHGAQYQPGTAAPAFRIQTLDGDFTYPPPAGERISVVLHAFTNKSAFLECLWTDRSSLAALVQQLPEDSHVVFASLDDSGCSDVQWMRAQIQHAAKLRGKDVLGRMHFSSVPVFGLGNWIPSVLYSWTCDGVNCGLSQVVFTSKEWGTPIVAKRLDAKYDWLMGRWTPVSHPLVDGADGCSVAPAVAGAVAWVSEGNCSFFAKVKNMASSKALGVLVYAGLGDPIQLMDCAGAECYTQLSIPASMVHLELAVADALRGQKPVNVSFQRTPSPNFFFGIDQDGKLAEMGWFLYPTFKFLVWQTQWFDYAQQLHGQLQKPSQTINVFNHTLMQGDRGAVATVGLPEDLFSFDVFQLDTSLSCPDPWDESCAPWDHTVQLFVCCDRQGPLCGLELGRWITAFRRGIGRWLTDASPLLALLDGGVCTFTMKTVPWAKPWITSLNLRFSKSNQSISGKQSEALQPFLLQPLFNGGTFDKNYNKGYKPINFTVPASTRKVEIYAVITGHGSDDQGCCEFCVTSHHFVVNDKFNHSMVFDEAGTAFGCADHVTEGVVPNEHGTWLYGRGGWCDGQQVTPWRTDITSQLDMTGSNTVLYFGLYNGRDPNPTSNPGYIIMYSYVVFFK